MFFNFTKCYVPFDLFVQKRYICIILPDPLQDRPPQDSAKFRSCFSLSGCKFRSFFSLSLGLLVELWPRTKAVDHPKMRVWASLRSLCDTSAACRPHAQNDPKESKRADKIPREYSRSEKKKKSEILGLHPSGANPFVSFLSFFSFASFLSFFQCFRSFSFLFFFIGGGGGRHVFPFFCFLPFFQFVICSLMFFHFSSFF